MDLLMTESLCSTGCGRTSADAWLCRGCTRRLEYTYGEMPALMKELETTLARQANAQQRSGGSHTKKADHPLPFDANASNLLHDVQAKLVSQIRDLCETRRIPIPMLDRAEPMTRWLLSHIGAIRQHHGADVIFRETVELNRKLRSATDNHLLHFAGPCNALLAEVRLIWEGDRLEPVIIERECGAMLRMRENAETIVCRECKTVYETYIQMRWVLDMAPDALYRIGFIDASLATARYTRPGTAIKWVQRDELRKPELRRFFAWQVDGEGNDMYRLGDFVSRAKVIAERREAAEAKRTERIGA